MWPVPVSVFLSCFAFLLSQIAPSGAPRLLSRHGVDWKSDSPRQGLAGAVYALAGGMTGLVIGAGFLCGTLSRTWEPYNTYMGKVSRRYSPGVPELVDRDRSVGSIHDRVFSSA